MIVCCILHVAPHTVLVNKEVIEYRKMNKQFKERMDEIQLRTEQLAERKNYESEIDMLEEKLKELESNYQHLQTTCEFNLEELALKQVDLVVAKDAYAFAKSMLDEKQILLVEEKGKLNNMHWQVWEEQINVCDEMGKMLVENDSVGFLNEYPRVLKTRQKYAFLATDESDREIKKLVAEHPEIKRLTEEIALLENEIKKIENSCCTEELKNVFTEISELESNDKYKIDETEKLIQSLEDSHRERMALEADITEIENRKIVGFEDEIKTNDENRKDFSFQKNNPKFYNSQVGNLQGDYNIQFKKKLKPYNDIGLKVCDNELRDKKLKAKEWYEEHCQEFAINNKENDSTMFYTPINPENENSYVPSSHDDDFWFKKTKNEIKTSESADHSISSKGQFYPKNIVEHTSIEMKSQVFNKMVKNPCSFSANTSEYHRNLKTEKDDMKLKTDSQKTIIPIRKFESFMATPNYTIPKSVKETAFHYHSIESSHDEEPSSSDHDITKLKKPVKFTPKRPSNIVIKSGYRQQKLDDFHNFMLSVKKDKN